MLVDAEFSIINITTVNSIDTRSCDLQHVDLLILQMIVIGHNKQKLTAKLILFPSP